MISYSYSYQLLFEVQHFWEISKKSRVQQEVIVRKPHQYARVFLGIPKSVNLAREKTLFSRD